MTTYPKPPYRPKRRQINASPSAAEYQQLLAAADKKGLTVSRYVLMAALSYEDEAFLVPTSLREDLQQLTVAIRKVGSNLNQISKVLNTFKQRKFWIGKLPADVGKLEELVYGLETEIRERILNPPRKEGNS